MDCCLWQAAHIKSVGRAGLGVCGGQSGSKHEGGRTCTSDVRACHRKRVGQGLEASGKKARNPAASRPGI